MTGLAPKLQYLLLAIVLIAAYFDIRYRRIPNWLVGPALLIGFAVNTLLFGWAGLAHAGLGFGLAILIYFPLYMLRGMGAGDVKLMAAIGALVGWRIWLAIFIFTGLLGGVLAIVLILIRGRLRRTFTNTFYILWDLMNLRQPYLRSAEVDVRSDKAFRLPHGAVIALGAVTLCGIMTFLNP